MRSKLFGPWIGFLGWVAGAALPGCDGSPIIMTDKPSYEQGEPVRFAVEGSFYAFTIGFFEVERQEAGRWVPLIIRNCSAVDCVDGEVTHPTRCGDVLECKPSTGQDWTWKQEHFESMEATCGDVSILLHEERAAPPGHYRVLYKTYTDSKCHEEETLSSEFDVR